MKKLVEIEYCSECKYETFGGLCRLTKAQASHKIPDRCLLPDASLLQDLKHVLDSITCLCAEGIEFMTRGELAESILRNAKKGLEICERLEGRNDQP